MKVNCSNSPDSSNCLFLSSEFGIPEASEREGKSFRTNCKRAEMVSNQPFPTVATPNKKKVFLN